MKNLNIKALMVIVAITLIGVGSAFTSTNENKESAKRVAFYRYNGIANDEDAIKNPANYTRASASCAGGSHVCGVLLATDNGANQNPDATELSDVADDLWSAEENGSTTESFISMKN